MAPFTSTSPAAINSCALRRETPACCCNSLNNFTSCFLFTLKEIPARAEKFNPDGDLECSVVFPDADPEAKSPPPIRTHA